MRLSEGRATLGHGGSLGRVEGEPESVQKECGKRPEVQLPSAPLERVRPRSLSTPLVGGCLACGEPQSDLRCTSRTRQQIDRGRRSAQHLGERSLRRAWFPTRSATPQQQLRLILMPSLPMPAECPPPGISSRRPIARPPRCSGPSADGTQSCPRPANGLRVSRVDRTRDRSTYAEWAAVYVGCTRELDGGHRRLRRESGVNSDGGGNPIPVSQHAEGNRGKCDESRFDASCKTDRNLHMDLLS